MIFAPGLLAGRVALVTGGGTGIGRGIALELARAGADVAVLGRRSEPLESAACEIRALGRCALAIPADVRDWEAVQAAVRRCVDELGGLDILVNNAGGQFGAPFATLSPKGWRAVIDLNLNGVFHCIRAAGDVFIPQRRGKVINIIAAFSRRAAPNLAHSGAARAAVENLTRSLALEWAPYNIQLNCISPVVLTEAFTRNMSGAPGAVERFLAAVPAGRGASVQEVGWLAVFLASPAGDFMTGEHLALDGGYWLATAVGAAARAGAEQG
jgi:NAD(P)-dependent dehydrogenase (short-subunit alcohol dehydrogenase family)